MAESKAIKLVNSGLPKHLAGVAVDRTKWYCDTYVGLAKALLDAGLVTPDQLLPQPGRRMGRAVFLGDGSPMSKGVSRGWSTPGCKVVVDLGEQRFRVEITVSKEDQKRRSDAHQAARDLQEREEALANARKLAQEPLRHEWGSSFESWEGTKAQLQAGGLGMGLAFPGEPGAGRSIFVTSPQGNSVEIKASWNSPKENTGVHARFRAISWYVQRDPDRRKREEHFAPGVVKVIPSYGFSSEQFVGTAEALVACGLARMDQFPGQPGRGSVQCSYSLDGAASTTSNSEKRSITIKRQGKLHFCIERSASIEDAARRKLEIKELDEREREEDLAVRRARMRVHEVQDGPSTFEEFRQGKARMAEHMLGVLQSAVFDSSLGHFAFKINEGDEIHGELAEAFDSIRRAVRNAQVAKDRKALAVINGTRKLVAAKNDAPLQRFLHLVASPS